jgi:hypothetical protein
MPEKKRSETQPLMPGAFDAATASASSRPKRRTGRGRSASTARMRKRLKDKKRNRKRDRGSQRERFPSSDLLPLVGRGRRESEDQSENHDERPRLKSRGSAALPGDAAHFSEWAACC